MAINFDVIFDNGGGITLQTDNNEYVHTYDDAEQAAQDVSLLLAGSNTDDWEGHNPDDAADYDTNAIRSGGYRWHNQDAVRAVMNNPDDYNTSWKNEEEFYEALRNVAKQ